MHTSRTLSLVAMLLTLLLLSACQNSEVSVQGAAVPPDATVGSSTAVLGRQAALRAPELTLPTDAVQQEGEATVGATGFAPGEAISIVAESAAGEPARELGRATSDGEGRLSGERLTLPHWLTSGAHRVVATGEQSLRRAESTLVVRAKERWVQIGSYALKPAEKLGYVAGGFVPGEQVKLYLGENGSEPVATVDTDRAGNTVWSELAVPMLPAGQYTFRLAGSEGEIRETITILPFQPWLELSPWSGPPGSKAELNARGFAPGESVQIFLDATDQPVLTVQADEWGNLWGAGPLAFPADRQGESVGVTAVGGQSGARVAVAFGLHAITAWGELNTYAGFPGSYVIFSGGGFAAGERVTVHAEHRESPPVAVATTNGEGRFLGAGPASIPGDADGQVTFVFVGEESGAEAAATFKVISLSIPAIPRP